MRITSFVASAFLLAGVSSAASAAVVNEVEPNNTMATAQNLDGQFSLGSDPNVTNASTIPYVSVISGAPGANADWYSFTVGQGGSSALFDIDFGMPNYDATLTLFNSLGDQLFYTDDMTFPLDPGTSHQYDPYYSYNFDSAGQYFLRVASWSNDNATGDYQLNVSLQNPGNSAVPEPATWAMMLMGFGMVGYSLRRRAPRKLMQVA